jgi:hypothetical protein
MKNQKQFIKSEVINRNLPKIKYTLSHNQPQTAFDITIVADGKITELEFIDWLQDFVDTYHEHEGDIFDKDPKIITEIQ